MILGFLGKGGSGKSTVSSQVVFTLKSSERTVLAIDADHNMDLSYNLAGGELPEMTYLSTSLDDLSRAVGLAPGEKYTEAFLRESGQKKSFSLSSPEIKKFSTTLQNDIIMMTAGPQTDDVLYGKSCSHSMTTPLKILLPLLELEKGEFAVVDEKAGADGVSTGVITGVDVGVIVCEPALHSIKTAKQIAELMKFYETPYIFVGNKITSSEDKDFITKQLQVEPHVFLMQSSDVRKNPFEPVPEWQDECDAIIAQAKALNKNNRLERTIKKFERNNSFDMAA